MEYRAAIGLEVHCQLKTASKLFSKSVNKFSTIPNCNICEIDLGMPGMLPTTNREAIILALMFGLATQSEIAKFVYFARKNYFYPDLPKGYQISQHKNPIVQEGFLDILLDDGREKRIAISRAHLEEDAGKLLHDQYSKFSAIDFNRAGVPLLEIVSKPDMENANEAVTYLKSLHTLVRHLEISDGNMQEGSFRCDANVSVRPKDEKKLGTRCELKNINSFRFVKQGINYEIKRQIKLLEKGDRVIQETRLYDAQKKITVSMRSKEDVNDYRYFFDPDLPPIPITSQLLEEAKRRMPELPQLKQQRLCQEYELNKKQAISLIEDGDLADFFEATCKETQAKPVEIYHWIMGELLANLNLHRLKIASSPIDVKQLANLMQRIHDKTISGKLAKEIFKKIWDGEKDVDEIIEREGLHQIIDMAEIEKIIDVVILENANQVQEYKNGEEKIFGFLVGQIMKLSKGKINPQKASAMLKVKLQA